MAIMAIMAFDQAASEVVLVLDLLMFVLKAGGSEPIVI